MSKVLDATCAPGKIVSSEGFQVPSATVFSEGMQNSSGALILDKEKAWYFTSNASDIKTTLDKISLSLTQIATALTALDAKPTGGAGSAVTPVTVASVAQINVLKSEIDLLKGALK